MNYFISYLVAVNLLNFIFFWNDKRRAKKEAWRIPEKTLIGLCLIGGSIGGFLGMRVFHHKTKHFLFAWGIPIILIIQIGVGLLFFFKVLN